MKIIYNSKLAKLLIPGFSAILIMCWLLCKKDESYYGKRFLEHEKAHSYQWKSLMIPGLFLFAGLSCITSCLWYLLLVPFTFYIWYVIEWFIRFLCKIVKTPPTTKFGFKNWIKGFGNLSHDAYRAIAFEQEARLREKGEWTLSLGSFAMFY